MSVTPIPRDLKRAVIELHGIRCLKCHVVCTVEWWAPRGLHIDHVIPESRGGRTVLSNLQVLCRTCNLAKGATTADYRKAGHKGWNVEELAKDVRDYLVPGHQPYLIEPHGRGRFYWAWCGCDPYAISLGQTDSQALARLHPHLAKADAKVKENTAVTPGTAVLLGRPVPSPPGHGIVVMDGRSTTAWCECKPRRKQRADSIDEAIVALMPHQRKAAAQHSRSLSRVKEAVAA